MDRYFMSHYNRKDLGLTLWHVIKFKIYFGLRDIKGENKHVQGHVYYFRERGRGGEHRGKG